MPGADPIVKLSDVAIRPLRQRADYEDCDRLQRDTWGEDFRELVPPAVLLVAEKIGGVVAGAFLGDQMVGFVFGLSGLRERRPVHWSHMLAVDESLRDRGIGLLLKEYQRDRVLELGIDVMYWTFDPLVARNAHLNLNRLGARAVEYVPHMYGDDPESTIDDVIGTDRFVVEWRLVGRSHEDVAGPSIGRSVEPPIITPESRAMPDQPAVHVAIPADIHELKRRDRDEARAWREVTRAAFGHYLSSGYVVRGFATDRSRRRSHYVLESTSNV